MMETLGYVTPVRAYLRAGEIYMHAASGRVADALARHYEKVYVCARVVHGAPPAPADLPLQAANLELIPQPFWGTSAGALPHLFGIVRAYIRTCRRADVLFVRGMCPYAGMLYLCAFVFRKPVCHWIVGDSISVLQAGRRKGAIFDTMVLLFAWQDRICTRLGRWFTGGALLCNGRALAHAYASPRTSATVSSTVKETEFHHRVDTCQGQSVRILFVGYIRPEKGIEYLLEAVSRLRADICWNLEIVGSDEFPEYRRRLDEIVAARGIQDRVHWAGYAPCGTSVFEHMRAADIFVLPSLSEGTPHVLAEARASGLPCISTTVGGVPTAVTDGFDALLVAPRSAQELARAIDRLVGDGALRRSLIRNGFVSVRRQTLECFVDIVRKKLETNPETNSATGSGAVLQQ